MMNLTFGGVKFFLGAPRGAKEPDLNNRKVHIQNCGLNLNPKFQHSSPIKKCLKIGDFWGFRTPKLGRGPNLKNLKKKPHTQRWSEPTATISAPYLN